MTPEGLSGAEADEPHRRRMLVLGVGVGLAPHPERLRASRSERATRHRASTEWADRRLMSSVATSASAASRGTPWVFAAW